MGVAAGQDLTSYLRGLGLTVGTCPEVAPKTIQARLAAYDHLCQTRRADRHADQSNRADYLDRQTSLSGDSWKKEWTIEADDSWFRLDEIWADDIRWFRCAADRAVDPSSPPSEWRFGSTIHVSDESRRGVLLAAAPSIEHPFRMARMATIPKQGKTTIYIGAARRLWCRSALALRVDGTVIWRRQMNTDLWIHVPIDLTAYAGNTIRLSLECDADGNPSSREVLLDYVVIETKT